MRRRHETAGSGEAATNEYLTTGEVARLFGVSPSAVTRWARTGVIKAIRTPGGHFRFRAADVRGRTPSTLDDLVRLD